MGKTHRHYKVVEVRQKSMLKGRLRADGLEKLLNQWSGYGWRFDRALAGETFYLGRDTFMLVFYQDTEVES